MASTYHRGYYIQSGTGKDIWHVRIKKQILSGKLVAVKKSIDWWCETATIISPKEFESLTSLSTKDRQKGQQEEHKGYLIKNDSGEKNDWYCFFNGKLVKGPREAIEKHIDKYVATAAKRNK